MGKIRTTQIKRTSRKLASTQGAKLSKSFEENKKAMKDLVDVQSKHLRNKLAGYITRLMKQEKYSSQV